MLSAETTPSEKASIHEFLRVLESFLNQQQIVSIGPFGIDLQTRGGDNSRVLVIQSEVNLRDSMLESYCLSGATHFGGSEAWELGDDDVLFRPDFTVDDLDNIFPASHGLTRHAAIGDSLQWNDNMSSGPSSIFASQISDENAPLGIPPTFPQIDQQFNLFSSNILYSNSSTTLDPTQAFDAISHPHRSSNVSIPAKATGKNTALPAFSGDIFLPQSLDGGSGKAPSRLPNSSDTLIVSLSRKLLNDDYLALLESELPRWTREGLWHEKTCSSISSLSTKIELRYKDLEQAYSSVCQLDVQMGDDAIKHRMALIRLHMEYTKIFESWKNDSNQTSTASTIGRGNATLIIDAILESIHEDWKTLDHRRRSDLRAKFHNRKKYGKRWSVLVDVLGFGILLLCSVKVANIVKNTTVTAKTLEAIARRVQASEVEIMRILAIINPLSNCLFTNDGYSQYDGAEILWRIRNVVPTNTYK